MSPKANVIIFKHIYYYERLDIAMGGGFRGGMLAIMAGPLGGGAGGMMEEG